MPSDCSGEPYNRRTLEPAARGSQAQASLDIDALPILPGAAECAGAGILSSLHPQNLQAQREVANAAKASGHQLWPLLFDPQTGTPSPGGRAEIIKHEVCGRQDTFSWEP